MEQQTQRQRDAKNLRRFRNMAVTIPAGGYLVAVFDDCDGGAGFWHQTPEAIRRGDPVIVGAVFDKPELVREALQYLDHLTQTGRLMRGGRFWYRREDIRAVEKAPRFSSALKEYIGGKLQKYLVGRVL